MSGRGEYDSLIDESARRRFEEAWLDGRPEAIELFLPGEEDPAYLPTLEELVHIELEFAWSAFSRQSHETDATAPTLSHAPLVETYLQRFARLNEPAIIARLLQQELRARCDAGCAPSLDDYRHRFPALVQGPSGSEGELGAILSQYDTEAFHETLPGRLRSGSGTPSHAEASEGFPRVFGHYELLEPLGRGGMGVVYRARQTSADRIVALKVIRRDWLEAMSGDLRAAALDRFRHEAQAAAKIEHENIVRVYEVGDVAGEPFFSMQYVDGQSLAALIAARPLSGHAAASILEPVARAVDEAHRRGILHRDLKPQNILVDRETRTPLVADFGLAKLVQANDGLTCAGDVMGSPPYMSPEQARDSSLVTTQSDVYALGATLYHSLVGQPPFKAETLIDTLNKVVHEEPTPLRQLEPAIDLDLETICLKCLQKEPARRYASAAALADDLHRYLAGVPISARPVGTLERCWLWCRRNPLVATLTISTALFLALTLVASVVGYFNTRNALAIAEKRHGETRKVINQYFTRISEDRLLNEPGMQPLRKELLLEVLPYYHGFLEEFGDDPALRDELAQTQFRIGKIAEVTDAPQDALQWYRTARTMQEATLADQADSAEALSDLGDTLTAIGDVLHRQRAYEEALQVRLEAVEIRQRFVAARPDDQEAGRVLANSHMNLGSLAKDMGRLTDAAASYQRAQMIRTEILEEDPHNEMVLRDLAKGEYSLALLAENRYNEQPDAGSAHLADARRHLHQGEAAFQKLLERDPHDMGNQYSLVLCRRRLAELEPDADTAIDLYQRAIEGMQTLAIRNPAVSEYQADLAALYLVLSRRIGDGGDNVTARQYLDDALRILQELTDQHSDVPRYRGDLAAAQQELAILLAAEGQTSAARALLQSAERHFQELVREFPRNRRFADNLDRTRQILKIMSEAQDK